MKPYILCKQKLSTGSKNFPAMKTRARPLLRLASIAARSSRNGYVSTPLIKPSQNYLACVAAKINKKKINNKKHANCGKNNKFKTM